MPGAKLLVIERALPGSAAVGCELPESQPGQGQVAGLPAAGWKYLLAGFILFRVFDILKPFPIRRTEHLGGATGVVADDALAGAYAAAVLGALAWTGWLN